MKRPASEIMELRQFYSEEPFGSERDNLHAAMLCALIANQGRGRKKKPLKPSDFMIRPAEDVRQNKLAKGVQWLISMAKPKVS